MNTRSITKIALASFSTSIVLFLCVVPLLSRGADPEGIYTPLAPLPQTTYASGKTDIAKYVTGGFTFFIALAGVLAVVRIVWGGIEYMTSDVVSSKSAARETIQNAIYGLILAIVSWLILNTIDTKLTNFNLNITPVTQQGGGGGAGNP
jgi:hypothetical protein